MTATTHHHRRTQSRALLALGLPALIGVTLLAYGGLEANVPTAAPPDPASCRYRSTNLTDSG